MRLILCAGLMTLAGIARADETFTPPSDCGKGFFGSDVCSITDDNFASLKSPEVRNVVVELYATWCPHCKKAISRLQSMTKKLNDDDFIYKVQVSNTRTGGLDGNGAKISKFFGKTKGYPTFKIIQIGPNGPVKVLGAYNDFMGKTDAEIKAEIERIKSKSFSISDSEKGDGKAYTQEGETAITIDEAALAAFEKRHKEYYSFSAKLWRIAPTIAMATAAVLTLGGAYFFWWKPMQERHAAKREREAAKKAAALEAKTKAMEALNQSPAIVDDSEPGEDDFPWEAIIIIVIILIVTLLLGYFGYSAYKNGESDEDDEDEDLEAPEKE